MGLHVEVLRRSLEEALISKKQTDALVDGLQGQLASAKMVAEQETFDAVIMGSALHGGHNGDDCQRAGDADRSAADPTTSPEEGNIARAAPPETPTQPPKKRTLASTAEKTAAPVAAKP